MKKSAILTILAFGLFFVPSLFADEPPVSNQVSTTIVDISTNVITNVTRVEAPQKFNNYIGLYAGASTGQGFTYRYLDDWGIQVSFVPYIMGSTSYVCFGLVGLKTLIDQNWFKFFVYFGGSFQYFTYPTYSYDYYSYSSQTRTSVNNFFNFGAGPGIEFTVFKHLSFDMMFGYAVYQVNAQLQAFITLEAGIFYRF